MLQIFENFRVAHWITQAVLAITGTGIVILCAKIGIRMIRLLGNEQMFQTALLHDRQRSHRRVLLILIAGNSHLVYEAWVPKKTLKKGEIVPRTRGLMVRHAIQAKAARDPRLLHLADEYPQVEYLIRVQPTRHVPSEERLVRSGWLKHNCPTGGGVMCPV